MLRSTTKILDYKVTNLDDRLKIIENILNEDRDIRGMNEFERYFDTRYKCGLNSTDALSDENNYCRALEQMADYLLNSEEIKEERRFGNELHRHFYSDKKDLENKTKREFSIEGLSNKIKNSENGYQDIDNAIEFLKKKDNFLKAKKQTITKQDLEEDSRCGEILRDYQRYNDYLGLLLTSPTNGDGYKIRKIKGSLKDDMIYTKDSLNGVFGYVLRHDVKSDCTPDWSNFDWTNYEQMKALLYIQRELMPNDDLALLILDLEMLMDELISQNLFTPKELEVYKLIRRGYKNTEIAEVLGVKKQRISNIVNSLTTKICEEIKKMGY